VGQPIGSRYELDEQLGRGAFGSVWRGRVRETGEAIAVKVLLEELATDPDVVTRFLRERTALVNLRHRSLVAIRDLVVEGDVLALVMQLVEGPDLRAYLRGRGTLGPEEAALLVADVADALSVAHAAKIVHRDVKPANVLLQPDAGGYRPLLTDFGIARLADAPSVTRTSQVVGTPYYLSPEVISGRKATSAVDIYAAGIMLYELLTGRPPFRGSDAMEVFRAHQTAAPVRPPGVSDRLWAVATAALAKDPDHRPIAGELASRLRAAVRVNQDGTTVRLPMNPTEGTVVLPALPADFKIAAGMGAVGPGAAPWGNRGQQPQMQPQQQPHGARNGNAPTPQTAPPQTVPLRQQPQAGPGQAAQNQAALNQAALNQAALNQAALNQAALNQAALNRAAQAAPTTQPARSPIAHQPQSAPPQAAPVRPYPASPQRTTHSPANQQQPQQPQYPMAYQQPPRPAPSAQYRPPQQQTYQAPRNKAPRQPQSYAPNSPTQTSGLSCLSKLAILVIVLAVAIAIGVGVGRQLAKNRSGSGANTGNHSSLYGGYSNEGPGRAPAGVSVPTYDR
jgi:serine/threonine-protein kinase